MATMKTLNGYGFDATTLGGVAASDYLKKTDTASDTFKLGGKAPEYYIQPRNLLDNSDFRNPVNQRGITNVSTAGYCIDRWIFGLSGSGALSVQDGLLAFNASDGRYCEIVQIQENSSALSEKEMTFAVCVAPDNIICLNFTYGTSANVESADENISLIHYNGDRVYIRIFSTGNNWIGVKWAALYEGTYTADTLPPYVPKGYAAELAECQRYFRKGAQAVTIGTQYGSGSLFSLSVPGMRIKPTVTLTDISSQGWGTVAASNYTLEWNGDLGSSFYANYFYSVSDDVGKTVVVFYEMSADL